MSRNFWTLIAAALAVILFCISCSSLQPGQDEVPIERGIKLVDEIIDYKMEGEHKYLVIETAQVRPGITDTLYIKLEGLAEKLVEKTIELSKNKDLVGRKCEYQPTYGKATIYVDRPNHLYISIHPVLAIK